jgi:hypothetical protein
MRTRWILPKSYSFPAALAAGLLLLAAGDIAVAGNSSHGPLHGAGSSHDPIVRHPVHGAGSSHDPIVECTARRGGCPRK